MKKIKYTPDAADKLRYIKKEISQSYGQEVAKKTVQTMMNAIKGLGEYEKKGIEAAKMFDVDTDYRYLYVAKNYVFYRIEEHYIRVINIYNEREDFMWQLFGIDTTSQETLDYWKE